MFCKSCNCNSSIATRIGFAVWDFPKIEPPELTTPRLVYADDIPDQFDVGVAHEDPYGDQVD